ncbi:Uncharacterised protein [Citrobacter freundii]|nr:Uncharacterised protein [Citrobacter freundii]
MTIVNQLLPRAQASVGEVIAVLHSSSRGTTAPFLYPSGFARAAGTDRVASSIYSGRVEQLANLRQR